MKLAGRGILLFAIFVSAVTGQQFQPGAGSGSPGQIDPGSGAPNGGIGGGPGSGAPNGGIGGNPGSGPPSQLGSGGPNGGGGVDGSISIKVDSQSSKKVNFGAGVVLETGINNGVDGGLYAELLANRDFSQGAGAGGFGGTPGGIPGWSTVGQGTKLNVVEDSGHKVAVVTGSTTGACGLSNEGFFGKMTFTPFDHPLYFSIRTPSNPGKRKFKAGLYSKQGMQPLLERTFEIDVDTQWKRHVFLLQGTSAQAGAQAIFVLQSMDGCGSEGFQLRTVSLFGKMWNNLPIRYDLGEALAEMKPAYIRIAGGNDLEGADFNSFFNWTESVGPIDIRKARGGSWGHYETNGFGLMEMLEFTERLGALPILGIYAGFSFGQVASQNDMPRFAQLALDMLHFCLDTSGEWANRRAMYGRQEPYKIKQVEIGNEDFMPKAEASYSYRFETIASAIAKEFPDVEILATAPVGQAKAIDVHRYGGSESFTSMYPTPALTKEGQDAWMLEYANRGSDFPTLEGSLSEGVGLLGMEMNGDVNRGAAYAPLLQNVDAGKPDWSPNLIAFDSADVALSTSYYVLQGFGLHRIDASFKSTASVDPRMSKVFHSVGQGGSSIFIKLINLNPGSKSVSVELGSNVPEGNAKVWQFKGTDPKASNGLGKMSMKSTTRTSDDSVKVGSGRVETTIPGYSFTVITLGSGSDGDSTVSADGTKPNPNPNREASSLKAPRPRRRALQH